MKANKTIALDIGTDEIRMGVFARHGAGQLELVDLGHTSIESDPTVEMAREAVVATALKRLLDQRKPATRKAIISIEGQAVFSRLVKLPPVGADKLHQTIRHEAVQNIPFPIDEVVWDAHIVDPGASEPEVLLVAAKADLVNGLVHAVSANGLVVERVDVAPAALANAVRYVRPNDTEPCLLVDAGKASTNLVFLDGPRTFFRALPVSGSMGARLVQEIERSIAFYRSQQAGNAPQRILLAGGLGDLDEAESRLGIKVEAFDPLQGVQQSVVVALGDRASILAGMAMGGNLAINLVPAALEKERSFRRKQPLLVASAVAAILLVVVWLAGIRQTTGLIRYETREVLDRVKALEKAEGQLRPIESRIAELEAEASAYRQSVAARTRWIENLLEIRRRLADGMFLQESEPIRRDGRLVGSRITVVSYLDKEQEGADPVIQLRDRLRASPRFGAETRIFKRPTKRLFARQFILEVVFTEGVE